MDILQRRTQLAEALTAHDVGAVTPLLHPSFVVRNTEGQIVMHREQLLRDLPAFFQQHPEYRQTAAAEISKIEGDTARLTTQRIEMLRVLWWPHQLTTHWQETWKQIDGHWLLLEEKAMPT